MTYDRLQTDRRGDHAREADLPLGTPGKSTLSSRHTPRMMVLRVESAEAARELVDLFGPRDGNGVAARADEAIDRAGAGGGHALPDELRARFEGSLGTDLSGVRLHTGAASADAARAVGARAFATGQDIHFGDGQYDPGSADGAFLVAHEVAHTVQQRGAAPTRQDKLEVSTPGDALEHEADAAAAAMVAGAPATLSAGGATIARKDEPKKPDQEEKPPWMGKKIEFPIKIGKAPEKKVSFSMSKPYAASLELGKAEWKGLEKEKSFPIPCGVGGFIVGAKVKGGLTASLGGSIKAEEIEYPGPYQGSNKGLRGTINGTGSLSASLGGEISAGGYLGAPIAHVALQGYIGLKGEASAAVTAGGGIEVDPSGNVKGVATFETALATEVKGVGGAKITYAAVITEGEVARWELASITVAKASVTCKVAVDVGTGAIISETAEEKLEFLPDLPPVQTERRPMTPAEKAKYRKQADDEKRASDGGSGAGPGVPPEAYEPDEEPAPAAPNGGGGGDDGGMCPAEPAPSDDGGVCQ